MRDQMLTFLHSMTGRLIPYQAHPNKQDQTRFNLPDQNHTLPDAKPPSPYKSNRESEVQVIRKQRLVSFLESE